jgi:hypothetical protein
MGKSCRLLLAVVLLLLAAPALAAPCGMRGVPPFGLPKISSFVGGIFSPTFAPSPLWSMSANRVTSSGTFYNPNKSPHWRLR